MGSPRESRVTVAPPFRVVKATRPAPRIAHPFDEIIGCDGGDEGTRTPDPRDANAVLSQLSYIPTGRRRV